MRGKDLTGKDGLLTPLIKQHAEAAMQGEQEAHWPRRAPPTQNGFSRETMRGPTGSFELDAPIDRTGSFEPQIVKKHQSYLTDELERKIIALLALGTSYQHIRTHLGDMFDVSRSPTAPINPRHPDPALYHSPDPELDEVRRKNQEAFMADLKAVYKAAPLNAAELELGDL